MRVVTLSCNACHSNMGEHHTHRKEVVHPSTESRPHHITNNSNTLIKMSSHYQRSLVILLIVFIGVQLIEPSSASSSMLSDHHHTSNQFSKSVKHCPETQQCSCTYQNSYYEIMCPQYDPHVVIKIQPSTYVHIDCMKTDDKVYTQLPQLDVGGMPVVQIRRCPLPPGGSSFQAILDQLGLKPTRTFMFQSFGIDLGNTLLRQHLRGLGDLERLALTRNGLTDVSEDLFDDVRNLTWLDLRSNKIHLSYHTLDKLDKLEYLELAYNNLTQLVDGVFRNQHRLKQLNLWGNTLTGLTKNSFQGLGALVDLDLSANHIELLQPDIFQMLTNLSNLNLSGNRFTALPEGIFLHNKRLSKIRLMDNRVALEELPHAFLANLTELEDVRIRCDAIRLPGDMFAGSVNIKNISLSRNQIDNLPGNIFASQGELTSLDLSHNKIQNLDENLFMGTSALVVVNLSHNQIYNISEHLFENLGNLHELYLNDNKLYFIHQESFATNNALNFLYLENNRLSFTNDQIESTANLSLGTPFQNLRNLQHLNLRNNSITTIFNDFQFNMPKLRSIDLSYNNIPSLSSLDSLQFLYDVDLNLTHNNIFEIIFPPNNMTEDAQGRRVNVFLDDNPLQCSCVVMWFVKYLQMDGNKRLNIFANNLRCDGPENLRGKLVTDVNYKKLECPLDSSETSIKKCPNNCDCMVRTFDMALIIDCSNKWHKRIPQLPRIQELNLKSLELSMENNNLTRLPHATTPGYSEVTQLNVKHNNISSASIENIPPYLVALDLSENNIGWVNVTLTNRFKKMKQLHSIKLGKNPWKCDCDALDFFGYIQTDYKKITDLNNVKCKTGERINSLAPDDLCHEKDVLTIAVSIVIALLGLVLGILAALYYKYQQEVKVWLFAHNLCLWFVTEEELDKDKKYDAFISYSHKDEDFITEHLQPELESEPNPFKLCLHIRDWVAGEFIPHQISKSVEDSRRTIVILSPNFLESIWGRMEFRAAHNNALTEGRARVIIVIYGDIGNTDNLDPELKAYLNMNTYVKWGDPWFWNKLRYALPHQNTYVKKSKGLVKTGIKSSVDDKLELIKPSPVTPPLTTPPMEIQNPLISKLNGEIKQNGKTPNGLNGHINGAFIINTNAKQSDV